MSHPPSDVDATPRAPLPWKYTVPWALSAFTVYTPSVHSRLRLWAPQGRSHILLISVLPSFNIVNIQYRDTKQTGGWIMDGWRDGWMDDSEFIDPAFSPNSRTL
jgi:hypothetical protein